MQAKGHIEKLPQAPLQEVIFELHWKLDIDKESSLNLDPHFQLASGRFDQLASEQLPNYVSLKPPMMPDQFFAYRAVHQYWAGEKIYPVMQLGPGLFSVNETEKNYVWKNFKSNILQGVEWLRKSYRNELNLDFIELRYIDAVEMNDDEALNLPKYLEDNLKIGIKSQIELPKNALKGMQFAQRFKLENDNYLNLVFNNGVRNIDEAKVVVWHTSINKTGVIKFEELEKWVDNAHDICSGMFKQIISEQLYERFSKTN
ncbi:MAG TPA: TIGR04255 family protein [Bacteroidia bacterium]|nr:TIGR04255 family protein [Bacteroidia bacterium]HRS08115.1 TIGR04255 family protein [Bacteroidia bacterium]HRU17127.1 TIGR04255 family protein [Bacteroidia bacterium]